MYEQEIEHRSTRLSIYSDVLKAVDLSEHAHVFSDPLAPLTRVRYGVGGVPLVSAGSSKAARAREGNMKGPAVTAAVAKIWKGFGFQARGYVLKVPQPPSKQALDAANEPSVFHVVGRSNLGGWVWSTHVLASAYAL